MRNPVRMIKPHGHLIDSRKHEIIFGLLLAVIGGVLLWDAFDGRGKKLPWPVSQLAPW